MNVIKRAISELFPDLRDIGITDTRMCFYTDSLDDSFVVDYVPGHDGSLFVASGGSGHGAKHLPVLGEVRLSHSRADRRKTHQSSISSISSKRSRTSSRLSGDGGPCLPGSQRTGLRKASFRVGI